MADVGPACESGSRHVAEFPLRSRTHRQRGGVAGFRSDHPLSESRGPSVQVQDIIARQGLPASTTTMIPILAPRLSVVESVSLGTTYLGVRNTLALTLGRHAHARRAGRVGRWPPTAPDQQHPPRRDGRLHLADDAHHHGGLDGVVTVASTPWIRRPSQGPPRTATCAPTWRFKSRQRRRRYSECSSESWFRTSPPMVERPSVFAAIDHRF